MYDFSNCSEKKYILNKKNIYINSTKHTWKHSLYAKYDVKIVAIKIITNYNFRSL